MAERPPPNEEPVVVLRPPTRPWLAVCAAFCGACVAIGFLLALMAVAHFLIWLSLGFVGIAGLAFVGYFLPVSSALILTPAGFSVRCASRMAFYAWGEVAYFAVAEEQIVAFRLFDTSDQVSPIVRQLTGFDGALPARYGGLSADALAARLNECRQIFDEREWT